MRSLVHRFLKKAFLLYLSLQGTSLLAQAPDLKFKYYTQKDGLSSSFVNCIAQDNLGFIWIGTNNGLNRFDGQQFKTYWALLSDSTQLPNIDIKQLFTQQDGTLWVSTLRGLVRYDAENDHFVRYKIDGYKNGRDYQVSHIAESGDRLLIAVDRTIYRINEVDKRLEKVVSVSAGLILQFVPDGDYFWITIKDSDLLIRLNSRTGEMEKLNLGEFDPSVSLRVVNRALLIRRDMLWIGTLGGGLYSVDKNTLVIKRYPVNLPDADNTMSIYCDRQNQLWTVDYTGLKFFDDRNGSFYGYYPNREESGSIHRGVTGFFQDKQNNCWVTHERGGVGLYVASRGFGLINHSTPGLWHLTSSGINCIGGDKYGNLWFGNESPSIDIFNFKENRLESLYYQKNLKNSLGRGTVNVIYTDKTGDTWVGSYDGGLQHYEGSRSFAHYQHIADNPASLLGNDVRGIAEDNDDNLWLVIHGKGVDCFNKKTHKIRHYTPDNSSLSMPWTNSILYDRKGRVWVSSAWGLNMLPEKASHFKNYYFKTNDSTTICSSNVISLHEGADGTIWVGTDQGLCYYDEKNDHFKRIDKGLSNPIICAIEEDNSGRLWMSTSKGISRIDNRGEFVFNFMEDEGVASNDFFYNSSFKGGDGVIYFGGTDGVTRFNPDNLRYNTITPRVAILNMDIDNVDFSKVDGIKVVKYNLGVPSEIEVDHNHKVITIEFRGISYNNPTRNKYAVRMDGFDKKWIELGTKSEVTYTNLEPGTYLFRVKAANNDEYWSDQETTVKITIIPPLYAYWWFKIIVVVALVMFFLLILKMRTRQLTIQKQMMSNIVRQKTDELMASNQELLAQAEYLDNINKLLEERQHKVEAQSRTLSMQTDVLRKNNRELKQLNFTKDRLFSIIAHDLLNPFTSIMGLSEVFRENYKELTDDERIELASTIYISSNRLFSLLQNLLLWARSQTSSIKFDPMSFPLAEVIQESTEYLNEQMQQKSLSFKVECDPSLCVYADIDMIKTVIRNLVNNAVKFSLAGGSIQVITSHDERFAYVEVIDNGVGMDTSTTNSLFDASTMKSTSGTAGEQGTGLGLLLCKEFVERNKGDISVESIKGSGSTFKFSIPLTAW